MLRSGLRRNSDLPENINLRLPQQTWRPTEAR
jgi:hypothetical protein